MVRQPPDERRSHSSDGHTPGATSESSAVPTPASASSSGAPRAQAAAAQAPGTRDGPASRAGSSPSPSPVASGAGGASAEAQAAVAARVTKSSVQASGKHSASSAAGPSSPTPARLMGSRRGASKASAAAPSASSSSPPATPPPDDPDESSSGPTRYCRFEYASPGAGATPRPPSHVSRDGVEDAVDARIAQVVLQSESRLEEHLDQRLADLGQLMVGLVRHPPLRVDEDLDQRLAEARSLRDVVQAVAPDALPKPYCWDEKMEELRREVQRYQDAAADSKRLSDKEHALRLKADRLCVAASVERNRLGQDLQSCRQERAFANQRLNLSARALAQTKEMLDQMRSQVKQLEDADKATQAVIKQDRQTYKQGLERYTNTVRDFHAYLQTLEEHRFTLSQLDLGDGLALPEVLKTFLQEFSSMEFALTEATSGSKRRREGSASPRAHDEASVPASDIPSQQARVDDTSAGVVTLEEDSDDDAPIIPSSKRQKKPEGAVASISSTRDLTPTTPKKKARLGRPSQPLVKKSVRTSKSRLINSEPAAKLTAVVSSNIPVQNM